MQQLYERRLVLDQRKAEYRRWEQLKLHDQERTRLSALRATIQPPSTDRITGTLPPQHSPDSLARIDGLSLRASHEGGKEKFKEQFEKYKQLTGDAANVMKRIESDHDAFQMKKEIQTLDVNQAPLSDTDIKKIDSQFENHLRSHPQDTEAILLGHLNMILGIPNHPITLKSGFTQWAHTWFQPFAQIEKPTPETLKQVETLISSRIKSLTEIVLSTYTILKKKAATAGYCTDAINDIIWNFVYRDLFSLVCRVYKEQDEEMAAAFEMLRDVPLSKFDLRQQFWLYDEEAPYHAAIVTLRALTRSTTVDEKLLVLSAVAAKIVAAVPAYWNKQVLPRGAKKPDTSIGGDELLPLMAYVLIQAHPPNICSEVAFMELLIKDQASIQQEGYLLATVQTALSLVLCMKEEIEVLRVVEEAEALERAREQHKLVESSSNSPPAAPAEPPTSSPAKQDPSSTLEQQSNGTNGE